MKKGHSIEVLVAYGKHIVLEGDLIEGIIIAKFRTRKQRRIGLPKRRRALPKRGDLSWTPC